jgi:hypothetical protein
MASARAVRSQLSGPHGTARRPGAAARLVQAVARDGRVPGCAGRGASVPVRSVRPSSRVPGPHYLAVAGRRYGPLERAVAPGGPLQPP